MNSYSHIQKPSEHISNDEIDLLAILNSLWRAKWIILIVIILTTLAADFYVRKKVIPLYQATASIALEESKVQIISDIESVMSDAPISKIGINTELEVLRSRDLIGKLVDELNLTENAAFNSSLQNPSLSNQIKSKVYTYFGMVPDESEYLPSTEELRSSIIDSVIDSMSFSNNGKTRIIQIKAKTIDAGLSILLVNTMANLYIKNQIQVKLDAVANATEFLTHRTSELKQDLEQLKSKLAKFSNKSEIVNSGVLVAKEIQLRDLRLRILEVSEQVLKGNDKQKKLKLSRNHGNLAMFINMAKDFRLNGFFRKYNKNDISLDEFEQELDRFMHTSESELSRLQDQLSALKLSEVLLTNLIERQSNELNTMEQLERETESARLLYESFFKRLLEMNVQRGLESADAYVLDNAIVSGLVNQKKNLTRMLGSMLGLFLASIIILLKETLSSRIRSINDLRDLTELKVLASVPLIPSRHIKSIVSYLKDKPNSIISESIRNLRTSILMSNKQVPKVIMVTSSIPGEGKTILSFALAVNMVGLGKKVLLIEADIRRTILPIDIDRRNKVSLVDIVVDGKNCTFENLFFDDLGFSILTGGKSNSNAADIFSSANFAKLLTDVKDYYDYVIIDTPPVLAVPDARLIGAKSDATIFIVQWDKTGRAQIDQGLEMLSSVGVKAIGLVMNQVDARKNKSYGYEGQYDYHSYGAEYYEN